MTLLKDPIGWWCALGRPLARLPRAGAIAVLAGLLASLAWTVHATSQMAAAETERVAARPKDRIGDLELYRRIHERVGQGESFYVASLDEQRSHNYPTQPFVTVRLPTLAHIDGALGDDAAKIIGGFLMLLGVLVWLRRLETAGTLMPERVAACLLLVLGGIGMFRDSALRFHELPAGMLLTLALALYRPDRWWIALIPATAALAIRELALPFFLLWTVFALWQKSWREAAALVAVMLAFAAGMALHAHEVAQHVLPGDPRSPGWSAFSGPALPLLAMAKLTPLLLLQPWAGAAIAVLPLIGWLALGGRLGLFASLWFIGYLVMMSLFARTQNNYWVLMMLPAYGAGLALVPRALAELVQAALSGQKSQS